MVSRFWWLSTSGYVVFDSVTTPLTVEAEAIGHVVIDLAADANDLVSLCNLLPSSYLPGAAS